MISFIAKTPKHKINIEVYSSYIDKSKIKTNRKLFSKMCKDGCKNYAKKYSCPPFSPSFEKLADNYSGLLVVFFLCRLNQIKSTEYNKVRIANSVLKARIRSLMWNLSKKFKLDYLSTGSCNLCKPCKLELKQPCKYPDRKKYSLESVGIDCNSLSLELFNMPFLWYKDKKAPEYTAVISALFCNKNDVGKIENEIENIVSNIGLFKNT